MDEKPKHNADIMSELNCVDKAGVWLERGLEKVFNRWGRFCADYPVPVIVLSLAVAIVLCAGVQRLKITTDPVQLWAAPKSRTRLEKDFFDSTFRPFYRAAQVIVTAKNLDSVSRKKNYFDQS